MGMFDTVIFFCMFCDAEIEQQTKAAGCGLKKYHQRAVPASIAEELKDDKIVCPNCNTQYKISCGTLRIALHLSTTKLGEDYD